MYGYKNFHLDCIYCNERGVSHGENAFDSHAGRWGEGTRRWLWRFGPVAGQGWMEAVIVGSAGGQGLTVAVNVGSGIRRCHCHGCWEEWVATADAHLLGKQKYETRLKHLWLVHLWHSHLNDQVWFCTYATQTRRPIKIELKWGFEQSKAKVWNWNSVYLPVIRKSQ